MKTRSVYLLVLSIVSVILFIYITRDHSRTSLGKPEFYGSTLNSIVKPAEISQTQPDDDPTNDDYTDGRSIKSRNTYEEEESSTISMRRQLKKTHIRDIITFPNKLINFDFSKCDMSSCFDLTRCNTSDTLKVHIVASALTPDANDPVNVPGESNIIHRKILQIIRKSKYFEPDPSRACLFLPEDDLLDRDPLSSSFRRISLDISRPENGYGMNYLIFNLYSGTWPDYRENDFSGFKLGGAILAKASNSDAYHRRNYDISMPLFSYMHPTTSIRDPNANEREHILSRSNKIYLLTFKGKRYVIGSGSETRNSLYHLNNGKDVIMLTTCRHGKKWRDVEDKRCLEDEQGYDKYDFVDLMTKSKFCLTPRGRRLGSFRFLEALNHTCIPVVLSNGWVWPFGEIIDWSNAAIQLPEEDLLTVPDQLRDYSTTKINAMQSKCRELHSRYFASVDKIVMTVLEIIERRIKSFRHSNFNPG